ncbi:MAG TPA: DUF4412 domain-containing protein [Chitinophagaceae bacterium]|nr:DUF4412 domain-containing protein [Chitinophagaceae bacterium]
MQLLKSFLVTIFSGLLLLACSGPTANKPAASDAGNSAGASGTGKDMYYEYTSTSGGKDLSIKTDMKMYVSSSGGMRVEMDMENSAMQGKGPGTMVIIGHSDKPNESISIDDAAKTYTINHFNDNDFNTGQKIKSTASKIGEEKILGFNSVHARIISNKSIGSFYSDTDTVDLWRSNDVPLVASVKELMDKFDTKTGMALYSADISNQLKQMGCEGFMTKMEIHSKSSSTTEVLIKVAHRDLQAGMFQIPAGYKEDKSGL